jgi:hypothetical protein
VRGGPSRVPPRRRRPARRHRRRGGVLSTPGVIVSWVRMRSDLAAFCAELAIMGQC